VVCEYFALLYHYIIIRLVLLSNPFSMSMSEIQCSQNEKFIKYVHLH